MLRFFRFNDPYRLLFVFLTILFLGIKAELEISQLTIPEFKGILVGEMLADGKSMYSEVWDSMPPVTAFVQYVMDLSFDRQVLPRHIVTYMLLFFQAAFFGILLINNRAFNESNYLPSFIFCLLSFFSFDTFSLTREIIGSSLLLLALNNLLKEIEFKIRHDETIHNLGLYLGLASLSVFSYTSFFIGTIILLFLFTRIDIRRLGLFLFGFLLPHLMMNVWYYWNSDLDLLWTNFYLANLNFNSQSLISVQSLFMLGFVPIVYFLFSIVMLRRESRLTKYQSQILQVMWLWLFFGLVEVFFTRLRTPQALLVLVPPLAYFISHYFLLIRRKFIAELMLWIFLVGMISINSLSLSSVISSIDFSKIFIHENKDFNFAEKKIFIMGDSLSPYINNEPSGYFLEWHLVKPIFEDPAVFQHVNWIANAFEKDPPDIILDPYNLMPGMLQFIPDVRANYRKEGVYYFKIPND